MDVTEEKAVLVLVDVRVAVTDSLALRVEVGVLLEVLLSSAERVPEEVRVEVLDDEAVDEGATTIPASSL